MKMTKNLRAVCAMILLTVLLFSAFSITAFAEDRKGVQWEFVNGDDSKLSGDGVIYEKITLPVGCSFFTLSNRYQYMNTVKTYGMQVFAAEKSGYLVYIRSGSQDDLTFYCRSDMMPAMQNYLNGTEGKYVIRSPYNRDGVHSKDKFYDLSDNFATDLKGLSQKGNGTKINVSDLKNSKIYELRLQDKSGLLTTLLGAVYALPNGGWGYVDYTTLDNIHFDADGNFSYRQGTVTVYPVEDFPEQLKQNSDGFYTMTREQAYESDEYRNNQSSAYEKSSITSFWIIFVLLGYLVPIAPFIVGLSFALSSKWSHAKRWYLVSGLAVVWFVLAILLTVLLLI